MTVLGFLIATSILTCVFLNDHFSRKGAQTRCYFILLFLVPNICGSFGLAFLAADNKAGRLTCYYLTGPYNAAFVMILSLTTANTAGHTKKVFTNAMLFLGYCTGNIAGPFFYKTNQSPRYEMGIWSMIVSHLIEVVVIITLRVVLSTENKRRDRIQRELPGGLEGRDLDATAFSDMTDREYLALVAREENTADMCPLYRRKPQLPLYLLIEGTRWIGPSVAQRFSLI